MWKVTYEIFGCPETLIRVFHTRDEADKFIGLNIDNFAMIKVTEVFH